MTDEELLEIIGNLRKCLNKQRRLTVPGDDRDGYLIDLINHMDAMIQQIEINL